MTEKRTELQNHHHGQTDATTAPPGEDRSPGDGPGPPEEMVIKAT